MKKLSLMEVFNHEDDEVDEDLRVQRNFEDPIFRKDVENWRKDFHKKFPSPEEKQKIELQKLDKKLQELNKFIEKLKQERKLKVAELEKRGVDPYKSISIPPTNFDDFDF